jgi:hypothetical protein
MRRHLVIANAVIVALFIAGSSMAQSNPFVGTWKLNVARSHYDPGPTPKSQTRTWEPSGKVTIEGIDAMGKPRTYGFTIKTDGKDYSTTGATNGAESVAAERIGANMLRTTFKRGGKLFEVANYTVSEDGKLLTIVSKGTSSSGQPFKNVQVWEKQ